MNPLQHITFTLTPLLRRMGLVGALGLLMLAGCAWLQWAHLPARQAQTERLASDGRYLRHSLKALASADAPASGPRAIASPQEAWQTFWRSLPASDQAERRVALQAAVLKAARAHGVQVQSVQYQGQQQSWAEQGGEALWRQRMTMPVQGRYAGVRNWLTQLLREPALSVDALTMQRDGVQTDDVAAQVTVSLWWRQRLQSAQSAQSAKGGQP